MLHRPILLHWLNHQLQTIILFYFLQLNTVFHTICLILCFQQAGEIDNLTVSLGQSSLIVLCAGSTLAPDSLVLRRATVRR